MRHMTRHDEQNQLFKDVAFGSDTQSQVRRPYNDVYVCIPELVHESP